MMISSKGRYALRVMIDLAENSRGLYIPLKEIAARQEISQKYTETIMALLSKNGLVDGQHGKGGGYRLSKAPEEYRISEILRITENSLAPVSCLECGKSKCLRADTCRTLPMWSRLNEIINDYFDNIRLTDLTNGQ